IEIYKASTGERVKAILWTMENNGDFSIYYTFPDVGNYQIVISIANDNTNTDKYSGTNPPRSVLTSDLGCNCDRGVFNLSISKNFGNIFSTAVTSGIVVMILVFGAVSTLAYRSRIKNGSSMKWGDKQVVKYS